MKKILALTSTFPRWQNDTTPPFVMELEKRLAKDFDVYVLAPHYIGAKKEEIMERLHVTRFMYFWPASLQKLCYDGGILPNMKKHKLLLFQAVTLLIAEFFTARKIIKNKKIQLIHVHWIIPQGLVAVLLYKFYKIPYIVTTHGGDIYGLQSSVLTTLKKFVLQNAKCITVVSHAIKEEIHKKINKQLPIEVVSMGVDTSLFNSDKYDETIKKKYDIKGPFLLFVGRLAEKKGVRYLLDAMPDIIKEFPTVKLLIVGDGNIKKELEDQVESLKIIYNVTFTGAIPNQDLPKYYATSDIFIGPSITTKDGDTEGLGLTFVEASLSGSVPIGTNVGGISDVIKNNETGFVVNEKNAQSIADTVIILLRTPKRILELKKNAREYAVKTFDWDIITNKYKDVYSNILSN
jgi:glycosyltransferase involved in cell wall biosynthesis